MPRNPILQQLSESEHTCFGEMAESAKICHDRSLQMSKLQPDKRAQWEQVAVMFKMLEGQLYDLATGGMLTVEDGKFGGGKLN